MKGELGRSGSNLVFRPATVVKTVTDINEPVQMILRPDTYVAVLDMIVEPTGEATYIMPRMNHGGDDPWALIEASKKLWSLWSTWRELPTTHDWRSILQSHLSKITHSPSLAMSMVGRLPNVPKHEVFIHGDPTLANLIRGSNFYWIDPLIRSYIPGDPHVDLGKMFQSCWGYERCLTDEKFMPIFDQQLAVQLADSYGLNYDHGWAWCAVHIARLLRYQEQRVADAFGRVLCSMCSI
jgi:hypothetical protein